ncbi:17505_t:CDS:2 [Acaulospora colombiana]|uniref:17505_t:CDS:1 n=1 Tax=Acaulospora colombiana TaxID=27376 RepID=A0ACA9KH22_9GLOM|nr:17505_t:CDS:2 [Acaulospora colombiana]
MGNPESNSYGSNTVSVRTVRDILLNPNSSAQQHIDAINEYGAKIYQTAVKILDDLNISLSTAVKARVIVALWATKNYDIVDELLPKMLPADVFKTCQILDAPRKARQLQKKLDMWENKNFNVRTGKKSRIKSEINNYRQELHSASLTSSFQRRIKRWASSFSQNRLDFFLLNFPKEPWKELADLAHLKASDFQAQYFLPMIYGGDPPVDSPIYTFMNVTTENLEKVLFDYPQFSEYYSYIRQKSNDSGDFVLNDAHKAILARTAPLEDVLWYYEELACDATDQAIVARLDENEPLVSIHGRSNYSKLMERILTFRQLRTPFSNHNQLITYAEEKLKSIEVPGGDQHTVAVFGDCSGSMEVAVKVATIIGSLLSVCLKADLTFFNTVVVEPPNVPRNASDVLTVAATIRASGGTAPAATLYPYYENKKHCDVFIVVTDEEENTRFSGHLFAELFKKYREEIVSHAQVFLVSFLKGNNEGIMKKRLEDVGIANVRQFKLDGIRPDLTKFSELLGVLTLTLAEVQNAKE